MSDELLKYKIGISLIPKIGAVTAKKLIAYTGSLEAVFKEKKGALLKIPGIGDLLADSIIHQSVLEDAEKEIEFITRNGIKTLFYLDKDYPERLKQCSDSPVILFVKGEANFNQPKIISIVGTRSASEYGIEICSKLIKDLAERKHNPLIVSGLAYGIDICAHRNALKNNLKTVAVMAHGLDRIYPPIHFETARQITGQGALISEFISKTTIDRNYFLQRNRIIAGISDATIVVESGSKGGALVTADIANSYSRDVFAFPGRIHDKCSIGCNKLIKTNKAALIESVDDLEYIMGWDAGKSTTSFIQKELFPNLSKEEENILNLLKEDGKMDIDLISIKSNIPMNLVSAHLLNLEFSGLVKCLPGKIFCIKK